MRCSDFCRRLLVASAATALLASPLSGACNVSPVALSEDAGTPETRTLIIDVLANDSDADGDPLTVSITSHTCAISPALGSPSVNASDQTLVFEPFPDVAPASCTITYSVSDGALSDQASVTVSVTDVPAEVFADGFESGDTSAWSLVVN